MRDAAAGGAPARPGGAPAEARGVPLVYKGADSAQTDVAAAPPA